MKDFWNRKAQELTGDFDWATLRYLRNLALGVDLASARVLELGCGIGTVAADLHRRGATVMAVDFSDEMIRKARALHGESAGLRFVQSDICSMALDQKFDLVCGIAVLHEIDRSKYGLLLAALDNHLASTGCAYFLENSYFNPAFRIFREHFVGRYGIPKYGSPHETPFDKARWALIQDHYEYSLRTGEIFYLLGRIDLYILRSRWRRIQSLLQRLDQQVADFPGAHRFKALFSYYQTVYFSHTRPTLWRA
jgi:SAM-dependent methyltransferase